jgi:hypothetical protein
LCLFITHWNPLPFETQTTVTRDHCSNWLAEGCRESSAASKMNSFSIFQDSCIHFLFDPSGPFSSLDSTLTTAAVYQSLSSFFHLETTCVGTVQSVTGV